MNTRFAPFSMLCVLLLASALAACGDTSDDEESIEYAITTSVTSTDPSKCKDLMTAAFREQNSGESGKAALEECQEEASDTSDDPESVDVSVISVDGSAATARVAFVGGGFDGQALDVALVKDEDTWQLDQIEDFAEFDSVALATTIEKQFEAVSDEIPAAQIACIGDAIRELPKQKVEELLLGGFPDKFVEFAEACE